MESVAETLKNVMPVDFSGHQQIKTTAQIAAEQFAAAVKIDENRRQAQIWSQVPPLYRHSEPESFPKRVWEVLSVWTPGSSKKPGFGLVGPTGTCKTRMVFHLLATLAIEQRIPKWRAFSGYALQLAGQKKWEHPEQAEIIRVAREVPILFIDDLGKQKFTEASEQELFDIVEERTAKLLPIIFTTNLTGPELTAALSDDVSEPLLRRLREFCQILITQPNEPS